MTANELADKLMSSLTMEYDCDEYMEKASAMLRHQENQIEALKTQLAYLETKVYGGSTK
jgi:hypothetical protein